MSGSGGAWKVAYADFVTAMMAFFLVMWITSQGQDVKQAIAGYFQDPWGTSSELQAPATLLPSEMHGDSQSLTMPEKLPHGKKPGIADSDEKNSDARAQTRWAQNRKVHFVQDPDHTSPALVLQFEEASAHLTTQSIEQLDRLIPVLLGKQNRIEIRGHSTRRPLPGDSSYHDLWQLCFARAAEVMKYLAVHGIEADRMRLSEAGASEPITNKIESAWQKENSRVEVFLLNELVDEQPGMEKQGQNGTVLESTEKKKAAEPAAGAVKDHSAKADEIVLPGKKSEPADGNTPTDDKKPKEGEQAAPEAKAAAAGG